MRKFFISFTACLSSIILCFSLAACSGPSTINPERLKIDKAYSFNADIKYGDFSAEGVLERKSAGVWTITLSEPFALQGVVMTYEQGTLTAYFESLPTPQVLPELENKSNSVIELIVGAFENAINGEGREAISFGDKVKISSRAGNPPKPYELMFDKQSLEPLTLSIPDKSLTAEFSEVQVSQIVQVILPSE